MTVWIETVICSWITLDMVITQGFLSLYWNSNSPGTDRGKWRPFQKYTGIVHQQLRPLRNHPTTVTENREVRVRVFQTCFYWCYENGLGFYELAEPKEFTLCGLVFCFFFISVSSIWSINRAVRNLRIIINFILSLRDFFVYLENVGALMLLKHVLSKWCWQSRSFGAWNRKGSFQNLMKLLNKRIFLFPLNQNLLDRIAIDLTLWIMNFFPGGYESQSNPFSPSAKYPSVLTNKKVLTSYRCNNNTQPPPHFLFSSGLPP